MPEENDGLLWIPLGGNDTDEIRANCHVFSSIVTDKAGQRHKDTIIVDIGADEVEPDSINRFFHSVIPALHEHVALPNAPEPKELASALFLTHAHADHIGGVSEYLKLGADLPPIYASEFTLSMLKKDLVSKGVDLKRLPELHAVRPGEKIRIGEVTLEPTQAPHSIPGSLGVKVSNAAASVYHSGDVKADTSSYLGEPMDEVHMSEIGREVDLMVFDATAAVKPGFARKEEDICESYTDVFRECEGKQVVSLIKSSHMERFATVLKAAENAGRDVIIQGGSEMQVHLMGLQSAGISLNGLAPKIRILNHMNPEAARMDPRRTIVISSGIEGNEEAPFFTVLRGEKGTVPLMPDAVVVAPLTRKKYQKFKETLYSHDAAQGLKFIGAEDIPGLDGSGHGQKEDFLHLMKLVHAKTIIPVHCRTKKADDFNRMASSLGHGVFRNQVRNGEVLHVSSERGVRRMQQKPSWHFVLWEEKGRDGETVLKRRFQPDQKMPALYSSRSFEERRTKADRLFEKYKQNTHQGLHPVLARFLQKDRS